MKIKKKVYLYMDYSEIYFTGNLKKADNNNSKILFINMTYS